MAAERAMRLSLDTFAETLLACGVGGVCGVGGSVEWVGGWRMVGEERHIYTYGMNKQLL